MGLMVCRDTSGASANWACVQSRSARSGVTGSYLTNGRLPLAGLVFLAQLLHLACASADTARRNGSSDSRPGWPAGTPPRATAGSGVDATAAACEVRQDLASPTPPGEPVVGRRTRQPPAGLHPNPRPAAM